MIIYAIVVTAMLAFAVASVGYEHNLRTQAEEGLQEARDDLRGKSEEILGLRVTLANLDGIQAGTTSDAMYKQFLSQFDRGQQVTVMLQHEDQHYFAK